MELLNLKETNIMKIKDKHNYQMGGEIAYFAILLSCFVPEMKITRRKKNSDDS